MEKQHYKIYRDKDTGERFVCLLNGCIIPAGPDRWLSEIQLSCVTCAKSFTLRELESFTLRELGETGQWCETCAAIDIQDN